jgi:membrane protease YdiL (CAAX protease family)
MSKSQKSVLGAWGVIISCIALYLCLDLIFASGEDAQDATAQAIEEVAGQEVEAGSMVGFKDVIQGKMVSVVLSSGPTQMMTGLATQQIQPMLDVGQSPVTNLCAAILLARAEENSNASTEIDAVIVRVEADPKSAPPAFLKCARIVQMLIHQKADSSAGSASAATAISAEDAKFLKANLDWYGELMISTVSPDPAFEGALEKSQLLLMASLFTFGFIVLIAGLGGFVWLVIVAVRWTANTLANPLRQPSILQESLPWIFAGWFIAVILIAVAVGLFGSRAERLSGGLALAMQIGAMFLPLIAIALPMRSGKSWHQIRLDIGLHCGAGFFRELFYGVTVYATAIPIVIVGAVFALLLSLIFPQELAQASHPIQKALAEGDTSQRVLLLFIAAVAAPIVEEIMFRGVLFVHLRDLSRRWGRFLSFLFSAMGSSLIFAAIHPQGIIFIPILGALAVAFCLAREMRGSLISCMVAHGINNALVVGLNIAMAG